MGRHGVILAGGCGKRLWPYSRMAAPKQFLELCGDSSLFRQAWERARAVLEREKIWVVLRPEHLDLAKEQVPELKQENILVEPVAKGTAAAVSWAMRCIGERDAGASVWILPSDHSIVLDEKFKGCAEKGLSAAEEFDGIVLLGIRPARDETQYGYIRAGEVWEEDSDLLMVDRFHEKPSRATALSYIKDGRWYWNSGMFFVTVEAFSRAMGRYVPEVWELVQKLDCNRSWMELVSLYKRLPESSLDKLLVEKMERLLVLPTDISWNDMGLWQTHYTLLPKDGDGNALRGQVVAKECRGCLLFAGDAHMIAAIGLHNLAVIVHDGAVLVCPVDRLDQVTETVRDMEEGKEGVFL